MKAEQLRKSILQLAIQGKLVPQNPADEPASVLLERIRAEKQRLIKEGKIKKDKGDSVIFKGDDNCYYEKTGLEVKNITDEIDFDLPDGWEWVRIKNFCLVIFSGKSPKYSKNETSHKVIGQQANQWSGVNMQYVKYCTDDFAREMPESYYLQNGDVLLNTLGNGTLGRSGIFNNNSSNERVLTDGHLFVFRTQNKVLSKYLLLFLRTKYDEIVKSANGTTNQTFLSLGKTSQWLIPVPPENEIIKIISELDKYEPLLIEYDIFESHKAKLDGEIYDKLKKSILQYAIQGKLVPQNSNDEPASVLLERIRAEKKAQLGKKYVESYIYKGDDNCYYEHINGKDVDITEEIPFDLPDSWAWSRWGELSDSIQYGYNAPAKQSGRIKMVRISDIHENQVMWENVPYCDIAEEDISTYLLKENDILFARTGGTVGKSFLVQNIKEEAIYAGYLIRTRYNSKLIPQYFKYFMESPLYWSQLRNGTIATAQPNCNGQTLSKMIVPVPPLNEQKRIVEKIDEIFVKL